MTNTERKEMITNAERLLSLLQEPEDWKQQIISIITHLPPAHKQNAYQQGYMHGLETALRIIAGESDDD